jgi:hypothetical protein
MKGLTYGRLDAVLRSFGLRVQEIDGNTRVYTYPGTEALFTVPILPDSQEVSNFHVMGARMTLDAYGIADADEVTARMLKAASPATAS